MLNSRWSCFLALACIVAASPASAEQWTAKAKLLRGSCGDRVIAQVVEEPNKVTVDFSLEGKSIGKAIINLAADGSGQGDYTGAAGSVRMTVSAGRGKRAMKTVQMPPGSCEWAWQ